MTVIGTASRPETERWVRELGAHHVIDHGRPLVEQLQRIGIPRVTHVATLTQSARNYEQLVEALAPRGKLGIIDAPAPMDLRRLMQKNLSAHYEDMGAFTRDGAEEHDLQHHRLLTRIADLVDGGVLHSTMTESLGTIDASSLRRAHTLLESGHARGKIVLEGFERR